MKPHQRRQKIVEYITRHGQTRIVRLAEFLQVSEITVRNDLRTLEKEDKLIRTHGGATLGNAFHHSLLIPSENENSVPAGARLASIHNIAQRAVALVEEGSSILLSGCPITQAMVDFLLPLKALTIFTDSIFIALSIARNPSNTVYLIGGQLQPDHNLVDGQLSADTLQQIQVKKAFFGCDGVNRAQGFACDNLSQARSRSQLLGSAQEVIILATGESIGRVGLMSFAAVEDAQQLITTLDAPRQLLDDLRLLGLHVTLCGEKITEIPTHRATTSKYRIAFANLNERQQVFAVSVRQSLEQAAEANGNIDLVVADNAADPQTAIAVAKSLIEQRVDLVIEFQQDEYTNHILMDLFRSASIPVIAMDIPMPGATFFGADNYRAGRMAGEAAIRWLRSRWAGRLDKLVCLEQPESGKTPQIRLEAQIDTIKAAGLLLESNIVRVSTRGDLEGSQLAAAAALRNIPWGKHVLFIGINSNSALGALAAAEAMGRQAHTAVISQNASNAIKQELIQHNPMLIGAVDYAEQDYGPKVVQLAYDLLEGRTVPPAVYTEHVLLTPNNVKVM